MAILLLWLENRTLPLGTTSIRPVKQGPPLFEGNSTTAAVLVAGSYSRKLVGPGKLQGGAGLAASNTLPFGIRTAGASIGNCVLPASIRVGPTVQVPGEAGAAGGE